ncbi:hypothetical protein NDN08_000367 [Rhodosorus marinus]|uniref:HNH nuclease domain-containing protein n=1 Tax=Rhodosorus marinus TaxID=101924 RepID=A0AAV8UP85_9RHOD|nr:hypothetical protein NDN08_000367 [Rhodosorus marinus]
MGYGLPASFRQSAKTAAKQFQQVLADVVQQECELAWYQGRKEAMTCVARRMMKSEEDRTSISTITKLSMHEIEQIYVHGKLGVEHPSTIRHRAVETSGHLPEPTSGAAFHDLSSQSRLGSTASTGGDILSEPRRVSGIDGPGILQGQNDSSSHAILGSRAPKINESVGTESGANKEIVRNEDLESFHSAFNGKGQSELLNGEVDQIDGRLQGMNANMKSVQDMLANPPSEEELMQSIYGGPASREATSRNRPYRDPVSEPQTQASSEQAGNGGVNSKGAASLSETPPIEEDVITTAPEKSNEGRSHPKRNEGGNQLAAGEGEVQDLRAEPSSSQVTQALEASDSDALGQKRRQRTRNRVKTLTAETVDSVSSQTVEPGSPAKSESGRSPLIQTPIVYGGNSLLPFGLGFEEVATYLRILSDGNLLNQVQRCFLHRFAVRMKNEWKCYPDAEERMEVFERQKSTLIELYEAYTGASINGRKVCHVIPLAAGGRNDWWNLVPVQGPSEMKLLTESPFFKAMAQFHANKTAVESEGREDQVAATNI